MLVRAGRAIWCCLAILLIFASVAWSFPRGNKLGDLGSFLQSGAAASEGHNPYAVYALTAHFQQDNVQGYAINRNPPISVPIFQAASRFDPVITFRAWYVVSLILYALVVFILYRAFPEQTNRFSVVWALSLAGVWSTLNQGQIYMPLVLIAAWAYLLLQRRRFVAAGLLIGALIAVKPNFLVWPVLLMIVGYWLAVGVALLCASLLTLAPAIIYGPRIYAQWVGTFASHPWISFPTNASIFGMLARLGLPDVGAALSVVLLIALAMLTWRRRPSVSLVSDIALLGSLLASPEAWTGYTLFLLPVFFRRRWSITTATAALFLMVPETLILYWAQLSTWHYAIVAYLDNWALLLLLGALGKEALAHETGITSEGRTGLRLSEVITAIRRLSVFSTYSRRNCVRGMTPGEVVASTRSTVKDAR